VGHGTLGSVGSIVELCIDLIYIRINKQLLSLITFNTTFVNIRPNYTLHPLCFVKVQFSPLNFIMFQLTFR
jgi:hypothetical protein